MFASQHTDVVHTVQYFFNISSLFLSVPLLTATYFRDKTKELLFGGSDNPSPLLEIVEQELAWRAEGKVDVFIDGTRDISALRDVLKVSK